MNFDEHNVIHGLEASSEAARDELEFGVVAMATDATVVSYNRWEATKSGLAAASVVGKHFFETVAPCTNNFLVAHRYESEPELDAVIDYTFTYKMKPAPVRLRLLRSPSAAKMYLLVDWRS